MHIRGWRPFWAALGAALLLLLPLAGGTVLLTRRQLRENLVQAAESQSGVAIKTPKEADRLTLLLCTSGEQPQFLLLYLNASQNCVNILTLPSALAVPFGEGETSLAGCYAAAGPARCREALGAAFSLPEDAHYLALSPELLRSLAEPFGPASVSFLGAMSAEELAQFGLPSAAQEFSARDAQEIFDRLSSSPARQASARAAVWDAFFRQKLELLPSALPDALREHSAALLTDLAAQDYYLLEETLEFLANNSATVQSEALPCEQNGALYSVSDASRAAVQALFNVSPISAQASSGSAP